MTSVPLTEIEARALLAIAKYGPVTCATLGDELWNKRRVGGNCSCPYARPAGAVVKKLRERGFVERYWVSGDPRMLYKATRAGERAHAKWLTSHGVTLYTS